VVAKMYVIISGITRGFSQGNKRFEPDSTPTLTSSAHRLLRFLETRGHANSCV